MDLFKLSLIMKYGHQWIHKWVDKKNIDFFEEMEQPMKPGESYKDYRIRLDDVSRKVKELRKKNGY